MGHCHNKVPVQVSLPVLLTDRNLNTAMNVPWVSLEFHLPFKNLFIPLAVALLSVKNIYHASVLWGPFPLNSSKYNVCFSFPSNLHVHLQLYTLYNFFEVHPPSFLHFFFFLLKQDSCWAKEAFVSSHFENSLSKTSYF